MPTFNPQSYNDYPAPHLLPVPYKWGIVYALRRNSAVALAGQLVGEAPISMQHGPCGQELVGPDSDSPLGPWQNGPTAIKDGGNVAEKPDSLLKCYAISLNVIRQPPVPLPGGCRNARRERTRTLQQLSQLLRFFTSAFGGINVKVHEARGAPVSTACRRSCCRRAGRSDTPSLVGLRPHPERAEARRCG